jgi:enoyl-CoA hydratase/carnithine racemase
MAVMTHGLGSGHQDEPIRPTDKRSGGEPTRRDRRVTDSPHFERAEMSREGKVAVLALASDKVNALDREVLAEIATFVGFCDEDPGIDALVLTGKGSVFSAGLNVGEILANEKSHTEALLDDFEAALLALFRCPLPTVAAINGPAIAGGCLLACACDRRLIAEEARIGVTELRVGVSFPVVAVELLKHVSGRHAERLMFDAKLLDAGEACLYGLAHQRLPRSEVRAAAIAAAEQLASFDTRAYALAKASSRRSMLSSSEDGGARLLDRQVGDHWQADPTRASLERLLSK